MSRTCKSTSTVAEGLGVGGATTARGQGTVLEWDTGDGCTLQVTKNNQMVDFKGMHFMFYVKMSYMNPIFQKEEQKNQIKEQSWS